MEPIEPAREAKHLLRRLEAAAASTRQMAESGDLASAYQNLARIEKFARDARGAISNAMTERRLDHANR